MSYSVKSLPIRWGILATGGIAATFTKDLLLDPGTRGVSDVSHTVVAAASSSSASRAVDFLQETGAPTSAKAYGSYHELVADPNVDIIYVATPHSHHFQNVMLCLSADKHVLCEKAFTVNADQARLLYAEANKRNLFLMEAVWTRFFPLSIELRDKVAKGDIGKVHRVFADLSFRDQVETEYGSEHRMVNKDLAGGVLLDLGIYSVTWVFQFLYHLRGPEATHQSRVKGKPRVASVASKYPATSAEESVSILLAFPGSDGSDEATGIATSNLRVGHDPDAKGTAGPAIRIQGTAGEIQVWGPAYRPTHFRLVMKDAGSNTEIQERSIPSQNGIGHGMFWEADACARALTSGAMEVPVMTQQESIVIMEVLDQVRQQNGLDFPEQIESTTYEEKGVLNGGTTNK